MLVGITIGALAILGGFYGVKSKRFSYEGSYILSMPAVYLGYFFIVVGVVIIVFTLTSLPNL